MNRQKNKHRHAMFLSKVKYRTFWRHFCILYNAEPRALKAMMVLPYPERV